ncbi:hypothetical protein LCGC14_1356750 [marine sediment metagenome]|uniref:Uncharacterized protein n=1 Tax=marine sediment metagenome TaxID=412755 RepID=A0A0F9KVH6_9ZZZZ
MRDLKVWMRVGDQDDYHDYASIDEAAEELHEALHYPERLPTPCSHDVERYTGPGLIGLVFPGTTLQGDNGVSFYWGDDDAQFEAEISDHELEVVQRLLSSSISF